MVETKSKPPSPSPSSTHTTTTITTTTTDDQMKNEELSSSPEATTNTLQQPPPTTTTTEEVLTVVVDNQDDNESSTTGIPTPTTPTIDHHHETNNNNKKKNENDASTWELHELYEYSVQSPSCDVDFLEQVYKNRYRNQQPPRCMREDFCGTAAMSVEWVRRSTMNYAIGIDLDLETIDWGRKHHIETKLPTKQDQDRIWLIHGDVINGTGGSFQCDIISAHNFSWMMFHERQQLRNYFKQCQLGLRDKGVFVIDIYGGPESQKPCHETTHYPNVGYTYHWIQESFNPITNHIKCGIYFSFDNNKVNNNIQLKYTPTSTTATTTTSTTNSMAIPVSISRESSGPSTTCNPQTDVDNKKQSTNQVGKQSDTTMTNGDDDDKDHESPPLTGKATATTTPTPTPILHKAFEYEFRLYSIPEVVDILKGCNFKHVEVYWEKAQEQGHTINDGNFGDYYPISSSSSSTSSTTTSTTIPRYAPSWMAYIAAYNS